MLRTLRTSRTRSGVRDLLDRLYRGAMSNSARNLDDFLLNEYNFENVYGKSSPDLVHLDEVESADHFRGGLDWLSEWRDFDCISSDSQSILESFIEVIFTECRNFTNIQALIKKFLNSILQECGESSGANRFLKRLVNRVLHECEDMARLEV
ncbi:uncharacterized protein [Periplaneta americana]|uniref:uncharacterized protein n=1 Tax=Periplaneta americana TaxID=6978 RepID=UPI0037E8AC2D